MTLSDVVVEEIDRCRYFDGSLPRIDVERIALLALTEGRRMGLEEAAKVVVNYGLPHAPENMLANNIATAIRSLKGES